jgi:hypothetical protein
MNGPEEVRKQFYTDPMLANGNGHDRAYNCATALVVAVACSLT